MTIDNRINICIDTDIDIDNDNDNDNDIDIDIDIEIDIDIDIKIDIDNITTDTSILNSVHTFFFFIKNDILQGIITDYGHIFSFSTVFLP